MPGEDELKKPDLLQAMRGEGFEVSKEQMREQEASVESEQVQEVLEDTTEEVREKEVHEAPSAAPSAAANVPIPAKDPVLKGIEEILAEDLTDIYLALPEEKKGAFRKKGEEVATQVTEMAHAGKVKIRKVLELIRDWLRMIPGVNAFFLEQEAKIKADQILDYTDSLTSDSV